MDYGYWSRIRRGNRIALFAFNLNKVYKIDNLQHVVLLQWFLALAQCCLKSYLPSTSLESLIVVLRTHIVRMDHLQSTNVTWNVTPFVKKA